ncbi:MAG TPA: N-acetyltransferase family protein [Ignavibacteria bacterium]|nr:N-acetyltransferase family protein [Ignavibacteria bacterium]HMQ98476.1 N-acetyltransferase family protein [Ignavibacteria bacterium]
MNENIIIREITVSDYPLIRGIYEEGIASGNATFEKTAPDWHHWDTHKLPFCRLAAVLNNEIIGWAALSATSTREVYKGVCEESIYISAAGTGKGIGKKLLNTLIEESEKNGVWTLYAAIFPENTASIKLHLSCGFREIGFMEKAGCMNGVWRDTILFERRSKKIGI